MRFSDPYLLNLLWLSIAAFGIIFFGMHQRKKIMALFTRADMLPSVAPGYSPERRWVKACLILLAAVLGLIALSGPLAGFRWEKTEQKGVDIMIALDCSKSMLAKDIHPDRLSRAKREVIDLVRMMKSDRAGLVAFAGQAILQCPLTLDHDAFHIFLNVLEPGFLPVGGSNLDAAITTAFSGFEKETDTKKAIILITDGENTGRDVQSVAGQMADKEIKIFTIGVGNPQGAPIPDENGGFKKDANGRIIMSKVDEDLLQNIAAITGGAYVRSVAGDMDLDLIYRDRIQGSMEKKLLSSGRKKVWENRFQWFLFPCVLLLIIELMVSPTRRFKRGKMFFAAAILSAGLLNPNSACAGTAADVKQGMDHFSKGQWEEAKTYFINAQLKEPDNLKLYYNIGAAAYMNQEYEIAKTHFRQATQTEDPTLKQDAMYNLANSYYRLNQLDQAISTYEDLLTQFPDDQQAKENLAFVQQKKQEQQQQQSAGKDPSTDNNRNESQNKDREQNRDGQKQEPDNTENRAKETAGKERSQSHNHQDNQGRDSGQDKNQPRQGPQKESEQQAGQQPQKADSDPSTSNQEGLQPTQERSDQDNSGQQARAGAATGTTGPKPSTEGKSMLEHKLNRLEDKPGRAMMPRGDGKPVKKDW